MTIDEMIDGILDREGRYVNAMIHLPFSISYSGSW